jgi:hypothetical protein
MVPTFVALLGIPLDVTVLVDARKPEHQRLTRLAQRGYLANKRVVPMGEILQKPAADMEDLELLCAAHPRRGATDRGQYREAAGAAAEDLARAFVRSRRRAGKVVVPLPANPRHPGRRRGLRLQALAMAEHKFR